MTSIDIKPLNRFAIREDMLVISGKKIHKDEVEQDTKGR